MSKAEQFLDSWLRHRLVTLEVLDAIEDSHFNYTPWDGAMSLGALGLHTVASANMFVDAVNHGEFVPPGAKPEVTSMADLRRVAHDLTAKTKDTISSFSDEKFAQLIDVTKIFGASLPGGALLHAMRDHEIHHKGQLYVYARMVGIKELPMFVKTKL